MPGSVTSPIRPREKGLISETVAPPPSAKMIRLASGYQAARPGPLPATSRCTEDVRRSTIAPARPPGAAPTTSRERPGDSVSAPPAPSGSAIARLRTRCWRGAITRSRPRAVTYVTPLSAIATPSASFSFTWRSSVLEPSASIATRPLRSTTAAAAPLFETASAPPSPRSSIAVRWTSVWLSSTSSCVPRTAYSVSPPGDSTSADTSGGPPPSVLRPVSCRVLTSTATISPPAVT